MNCRICGDNRGRSYVAREMMFGTGEEFDYFECSSCGCLQIARYPLEAGRFYRTGYFSFKERAAGRGNGLAFLLRRKWVDHVLGRSTVVGAVLGQFRPVPRLYGIFRKHGITRQSRILDVGCGNGQFLDTLYRGGFEHLTGVDPYVETDRRFGKECAIMKQDLFRQQGKYDYIAFNHSLEHLQSQRDVLVKARELLTESGVISVAIPVIGHAWRKYGVHWVQLDAPRHLYLHSEKSLRVLALQAGLAVVDAVHDSDEFQFWGSEQYRRGIPLTADNSHWTHPSRSLFTQGQISAFQEQARELNARHDGDQALFTLRRAG